MSEVYRPVFTEATRPDADVQRVGTLTYTHAISLPEDVQASFEVASPPLRLGALAIDLAIQVLALLLLVLLSLTFAKIVHQIWALVFLLLAFGALNMGYFFVFEGFMSGQTPGKRMCRLRVIRDDGMEIGPREGIIRAFTRMLEVGMLPALLLAGLFSVEALLALAPFSLFSFIMFVDPRARRLGDFAASTLVVRMKVPTDFGDEVKVPGYFEIPDRLFPFNSDEIARLSAEDFTKLNEFGQRIRHFIQPQRMQAAMAVAAGLANKMNYSQPITPQFAERFLFELYAALREQLRQLYPDLYT